MDHGILNIKVFNLAYLARVFGYMIQVSTHWSHARFYNQHL